jgi:hypothetical protein
MRKIHPYGAENPREEGWMDGILGGAVLGLLATVAIMLCVL